MLKTAAYLGGIAVVAIIGLTAVSLITNPFVQGTRILNKTIDADNVIYNYEWFHDTNAAYQSRISQIVSFKSDISAAAANEQTTMRMELQAMRQSCRDLVNRYNSNATKTNRSIFMGTETPTNLNPETCEQ